MALDLIKKKKILTVEKLQELFPDKKGSISDELVDLINDVQNEAEFNGARFVDTLYSYQNIMHKNSSSMEQYVDAVRFCAYIESGDNNTEAYKKTFIRREFVQGRINANTASNEYKELTSAATRYRKSPMVVGILTQADVPLYLLFQGERYKAVSRLVTEMDTAAFSKDRINAAKAVLENIKPPEGMKIEIDMGVRKDNVIQDYEIAMAKMVEEQMRLIEAGADLKSVANARIRYTEAELVDGSPE